MNAAAKILAHTPRSVKLTTRSASNFWNRVRKTEVCWIFQGAKNSQGYGHFGGTRAHRVAFFLATGIQPDGKMVLHKCDNPSCCKPDHLFLGSHKENMRDMQLKKRAPHGEKCPNHRLTKEQVVEIRRRRSEGEKSTDLGAEFGVNQGQISKICSRKHWRYV